MLEYVHLDFSGADDDIAELDMRARRASMGLGIATLLTGPGKHAFKKAIRES